MEESSVSTFNEASFKMKRLHELQERCNLMRMNPYVMSRKTHKPCFITHIDCLFSLYQEISSKLTKEEKEGKGENPKGIRQDLKDLKKDAKKLHNIMADTINGFKIKGSKEDVKLKEKVEDGIFDCEEDIRKLLDVHGFSTLNMEDDQGDPYN